MKTLKQIAALLLSIAALLASIFSLMDVKRNVERNKQAADFATQAILSAQSSTLLEPTLDVDASRLELLSTEVRNTELTPVNQTLDVQASVQKIDNKLKNIQEEKNSEKKRKKKLRREMSEEQREILRKRDKERYARKTAAKKAAEEAARAEILKGTAYELPPQESEMQRSA